MRLRHAKLIILLIVIANLILFYYTWKSFLWKSVLDIHEPISPVTEKLKTTVKDKIKTANKHLRKSITIIFRNFFTFENDLRASVDNILEVVPNIPIMVIHDTIPYPPLTFVSNISSESSVKSYHLGFDISKTARDMIPLNAVKTKYVLFMPDSVRMSGKSIMQKILKEATSGTTGGERQNTLDKSGRKIVIIPFAGNIKSFSSCCRIVLDLANWTIEYIAINGSDPCDLYLQKHAIMVDITTLRDMPDALSSPFPEMFYVQAKMAGLKKTVFPHPLQDGKRLFTSYHTKQRRMEIRRKQFRDMYRKLQIKRIVRKSHKFNSKADLKDGSNPQHNLVLDTQFSSSNFSLPLTTDIDLIGCERTTKSCIGSVYNMKPFYIYLNKHTPPCCLDKMKTAFHHVLDEFENVGIRYWLDNHALKTAIETGQLSLNAYEIDVSFNSDDLERSSSLKKAQTRPFNDPEGFYWIKATDGQYFRLQFSKMNQVGINLLPFEIKGNRVRPNGFFGWKAREFSSEFLHPMSTVVFLGKNVMCPNNVREYLDSKGIK